jgi:hypothetical protein
MTTIDQCFFLCPLSFQKIFIGGVSLDTQDLVFRSFFAQFGEIEDAVIVKDRTTGLSRGFGFVVYRSVEAAQAVMARATTLELDGRLVTFVCVDPSPRHGWTDAGTIGTIACTGVITLPCYFVCMRRKHVTD